METNKNKEIFDALKKLLEEKAKPKADEPADPAPEPAPKPDKMALLKTLLTLLMSKGKGLIFNVVVFIVGIVCGIGLVYKTVKEEAQPDPAPEVKKLEAENLQLKQQVKFLQEQLKVVPPPQPVPFPIPEPHWSQPRPGVILSSPGRR